MYANEDIRDVNYVEISNIIMIHYFEFGKEYVFEGESHDYWEMVYIDKGSVLIQADEEEFQLSQGEVVFHAPNEFHAIRAYNSAPNFIVVCFRSDSVTMSEFVGMRTGLKKDLRNFITSILREARHAYVLPKNDPTPLFMLKKENAPPGSEQLIRSYLEQLLIMLVRDKTKASENTVFPALLNSESEVVSEVKAYVTERSADVIRVLDVCKYVGYSKSYLSKVFKEQTGQTLVEYINEVKISRAKNYIRDGYSFSETSDKLSFDNPQYFSRVFKRIAGMTPTEFKATLKY